LECTKRRKGTWQKEIAAMKHMVKLTCAPKKASTDLSWGTIITVIAQILNVIGTAWEQKDSASA